eukprot:TRINITY_DN802_c0_g1_i1.p1 TRINITY_DN802_c0_g1~~TRINITY_DN802_c0_g1_i1.p1  ORF type:complete len:1055 (+),score=193.45 TRINITY_DN802_c0_g1_i1:452-3166(+)
MDNLDSQEANDMAEFSSSFSALFQTKLRFSSADGLSLDTAASLMSGDLDGEEPFGSLEELESHVIGNLLPDDEEELLAGVVDDFDCILPPSNGEESEDVDLFISGGGMELEGDAQDALGVYINSHRTLEVLTGCPNTQHGSNGPGSVAGEHPYGEHPSRTLFVRNINSNVEDTELRALFEQYGAIRTLYTACKHRGFVMISYYDIRAARSAMRALQNKPLRRRKLDIHFSIPKDNPSDKDVNQGTLVVFNLDASVSNDDLRQIFGEYGEVKEIRETPHKRHHKFIEFYDVRAAEAALRALNRSDIAGKRIKLEPSRPGGARRSLMQQLSQELEQEEIRPHRQQAHSPLGNSPPGHSQWCSVGSAPVENGSLRNLHHSLTHANYVSLLSKPVNGIAGSLPPHITPSVRVGTIGSHVGQGAQVEAGHSLGHLGIGVQRLPHHNSLPEFTNSQLKSVLYNPSSGSVSTPALRIRDGVDGSRLQRTSSGGLTENSSFQHASVIGVAGNGPLLYQSSSSNGSALSGHQFVWANSSQYHQHTPSSPPVTWSTSSVSNSFNSQGHPLSHGYTGTHGHLVNAVLSSHLPRVGSAPAPGEPSILERRHTYLGESPEASSLVRAGSLGAMGLGGSNGATAINICAGHGLISMGAALGGASGLDHSSSPNLGIASPQHRGRVFSNGVVPGSVPSMMESFNDRSRSRRVDNASGQVDNKKQYQLDLDRILRGEESRTTLMIKNIPNKYTSKMLLAAIDEHHRGTYDFLYLPIDFKNKCNVGYAFINMIAPSRIVPFYQAFNGKKWEKFNSEKVASLAYARIQGKAALVAHFQNSSLMNEDKRCRPILFHSEGPHVGDQEPFPVGVNVRIRPSRDRSSSGGSHQGSPSTSSSSRDDSVHGCGLGLPVSNFSPDRDQE